MSFPPIIFQPQRVASSTGSVSARHTFSGE
jgi:hypothetical protein